MPTTLTITGFGPFPGVLANPTEPLVQALDGTVLAGLTLRAQLLPVSFARAQLWGSPKLVPAAVVHFGLAQSATRLRLESQAFNQRLGLHPDVDGVLGGGQPIDPSLPVTHTLCSPLDIPALVAHLCQQGHPARLSTDPGRYVCNSTYYTTLQRASAPVLFVHVPAVWSHPRLLAAAECLLGWVALLAEVVSGVRLWPPPHPMVKCLGLFLLLEVGIGFAPSHALDVRSERRPARLSRPLCL